MKAALEKREYWQRHFDAWKSSGLTRRTYCEQNQVKISTLDYWSQKVGASKKRTITHKNGWIPVHIDEVGASSGIDLRIGQMNITVKPGL